MKTQVHPQIAEVLRTEQGARVLAEAKRLATTPRSKERIDALRRRLERATAPKSRD